MQLHNSSRPTIAYRPAFLGGMITIPHPQIWPLENGRIELSMMLPIKELSNFVSKWFTIQMTPEDLPGWLKDFANDPEKTILETFTGDTFTPNFNAKETTRITHDLSLLDDL